ncbi:multidrug effflux MFS transporter [Thalassotalea aquiviva]|uniref:multidrug effflux MFS transporter n=1 Tax=Thalassotalea aquiviva TaxID=3242415 RepID=UPI00352B0459
MHTKQAVTVPFYIFMMLVILSPLAIDVFLPAIPVMAQALQTELGNVQATVAIFLAAMGIGQILAGPFADKYGRRPLALLGIGLYVIGGIFASVANNIETLWLSRVLQGLGACAVSVTAMSGIRDCYGPERSSTMYSYVNGVICVIPALAPMLGGLLTEFGGWRYNFYLITVIGCLVGALVALKLPETRPEQSATQAKLISWERYCRVLEHPVFRFHTGLIMLSMAIIIGYVTTSTEVLMVKMLQSPFAFSLWFGSNAAINILAAFIAPRFIHKVGKRNALKVAVFACLFSGIGLVLFKQSVNPLAYMLPVYCASVGFCILFGLSGGAALKPFGDNAGTASALMGLFQMTGASVLVGLLQLLPISGSEILAILMALPLFWVAFARWCSPNFEQIQATLK